MTELMKHIAERLTQRGFEVYLTGNQADTRTKLLSLIQPGQSVGVGGSVSIRELDLGDALAAQNSPVHWHWLAAAPQEGDVAKKHARTADVYLASANAVTADGRIVNIDGTGNRVAATFQGPKTVILAVGAQKLVDGGLDAAIARVRRVACPANAKRLGLKTPCGLTGKCDPIACNNDVAMCRVITVLEHPSNGRRVIVLLSEDEIGY